MDRLLNWDQVSESIRRARSAGIVTTALVRREASTPALTAADRLAAANGFAPLGHRWRLIELDTAHRVLVSLLERDLAYGATIMSAQAAAALAGQFLALTAPPRAFFTNGTWAGSSTPAAADGSWDPITESTFDAGIIAVDDDVSVMLWVQEED